MCFSLKMIFRWVLAMLVSLVGVQAMAADPWADEVVNYDAGIGADPGYTNESVVLGSPTRASGGFLVSPFSPAFGTDEVLSIGAGGEVTVRFDEPVLDEPGNPFGIDLIVFGNSFFLTSDFNFDSNTTVSDIAGEGGIISISDNGLDFVDVVGAADGLFPTNGYSDVTDFFPATAQVPADFTRPVDPSLDATGLGSAAVIAAYNGSGGGVGVDFATYGLSAVTHVRVTNPVGSLATPEVDAFADVLSVPEPSVRIAVCVLLLGLSRLRRCHRAARNAI